MVERGRQAIFLVPEISLTPQTVERVSARFPGRVAVLHSRQKQAEKFNQWWGIRDGRYDVVVGPRSALFAPVPNLGLVVIDEEHEATFKQQEGQPRYHTRTTALELGRMSGSVVVLGSATPDVESYFLAEQGRYGLLQLPHRINPDGDARPLPLARTEICDMREELRQGNRSIFSRVLEQALKDCVSRGQQAILFLNRRGSAPFVQCRDCGYVVTCSGCAVSLTLSFWGQFRQRPGRAAAVPPVQPATRGCPGTAGSVGAAASGSWASALSAWSKKSPGSSPALKLSVGTWTRPGVGTARRR